MAITLDRETRERAQKALREYLEDEHELEVGDLRAALFLDFIVRTIGPGIYNQAIADAQAFLADKLVDLEASLYEPEPGPEES